MKSYIGTKLINATPMNRQDYNTFRGWTLPAGENGADEGYLVEYTDGGSRNTEAYKGYVSWSPKEQFDNAYIEVPISKPLEPHMLRVAAEKAELDNRLNKLIAFMDTGIFKRLGNFEKVLLHEQADIMSNYSSVLKLRLAR